MYNGLRYAEEKKGKNGEVYSCDKVQLVFRLRTGEPQKLLDAIARVGWFEYDHWESRKFGTYRNQFSVKVAEGVSYWVGVGMVPYGKARPNNAVKLEFNPNKVWPCRSLRWLLRQCWNRASTVEPCTVKQWDLAIDWPVEREQLFLRKDARLYEELAHSASDRTQYLGERNKPGRCKLYNKQVESHLEHPCTRLEVTLEGTAGARELASVWPTVYRLADVQVTAEIAALNDTDRFIFATLLEQPDRLNELGRRKRQRMAQLLEQAGTRLTFEACFVECVAGFVKRFAERPPPDWRGEEEPVFEPYGMDASWGTPVLRDPFRGV